MVYVRERSNSLNAFADCIGDVYTCGFGGEDDLKFHIFFLKF